MRAYQKTAYMESYVEEGGTELDKDEKIDQLLNWVRVNGGECNVEARRDKITGVRGLYASRAIKDPNTPLV